MKRRTFLAAAATAPLLPAAFAPAPPVFRTQDPRWVGVDWGVTTGGTSVAVVYQPPKLTPLGTFQRAYGEDDAAFMDRITKALGVA